MSKSSGSQPNIGNGDNQSANPQSNTLSEDCPKESAKQSLYSPDTVKDEECLARTIYHDDHVDNDTGQLTATAIPIDEFLDASRKGASVDRLKYISQRELNEQGERFAARKPENRYLGYGKATASDVRRIAITGDCRRQFCVVDDGLESNSAHAVICLSEVFANPDSGKQAIKKRVRRIREQLVSLLIVNPQRGP